MSRRMVGHATFAGASLASLAIARSHDVALIESPPLFLGVAARALRAAGLPYVFHVADPWPDFPIAMGTCGLASSAGSPSGWRTSRIAAPPRSRP